MIFNSKYYAWILSSIMHVGVLLLFFFQYQFYWRTVNPGVRQSETIASYIFQDNMSSLEFSLQSNNTNHEQISQINALAKVEQSTQKKITITKAQVLKQITHQQQMNPSRSPQKNKKKSLARAQKKNIAGNGPLPEILALLNAAIMKTQVYPANALQMGREGKTIVRFLLQPNGHIRELRIIKPSGTIALDEAAIAAVNKAAPFQGIDKYLTDVQEFQITVGFEL